ncbi:hypothetical protein IWX49DRAFT_160174 [Phyllosticta citricarpa]|uniref:Ubiquitin-like protease family profile domain-containing protein n=2 Tax=Phyllosticta TaxID=121621 RepID=A0ABR1M7Q1_9PEZI
MRKVTKFLKKEYPTLTTDTDPEPDEDLVIRAILSVTEAISQNDPTNEFSLYSYDSWNNQGSGAQSDPILRRRRQILLPWRVNNAGQNELILVHARLEDNSQEGASSTASTQPRLALTFYNFSSQAIKNVNARNGHAQLVRQFLIGRDWFDSDPDPPQAHIADWKDATRTFDTGRHFLLILVAMAIALNLQVQEKLPKLGNQKAFARDKKYGCAIIRDAASGVATPSHLWAALIKLTVVEDRDDFHDAWGQELFTHTVDLSDGAFDTHYGNIRTSIALPAGHNNRGSQSAGNGGDGTNHGGGRGEDASDPPPDTAQETPPDQTRNRTQDGRPNVLNDARQDARRDTQQDTAQDGQQHGNQHCRHCIVPSHCIPDLTHEISKGILYHQNIHWFRQYFQEAQGNALAAVQDQGIRKIDLFCVRKGMRLFQDEVILALMAVTESINRNGRGHSFSLFSEEVYSNSLNDIPRPTDPNDMANARFEVVRPRHDLLLPVINQRTSNDCGHITLAVVRFQKMNGKDDYTVEIFDSEGPSEVSEWSKSFVRRFLINSRWWSRESSSIPSGNWSMSPTGIQNDDWSCGFHTILNGWAFALGLPLSTAPNLQRLGLAVEAITYAVYGNIDCKSICQLLSFLNWVTPDSLVPLQRQFRITDLTGVSRRLNNYHTEKWCHERAFASNDPETYASKMRSAFDIRPCKMCQKPWHCADETGNFLPVDSYITKLANRLGGVKNSSGIPVLFRSGGRIKKRRQRDKSEHTRRGKMRRT